MHGEQFFFDDRIDPDRIFQPEFQPQIRAWLTDSQTTQAQREAFLQALLDFDDDCGGFYRYRSRLLAAEYLALCPECRQGDAIVDELLKLSYSYFRVEKADWGTPPEAFVRSARETLAKTDLGRVVGRLEQLVRTTESRRVMGHAARELLRIQPGNRCGIAAIGFYYLKPQTESRSYYGNFGPISFGAAVWRAFIEEPLLSDELAIAISQLFISDRDKMACYTALKRMIDIKAQHVLIVPEIMDLMIYTQWRDDSLSNPYQPLRSLVENLWWDLYQHNPQCTENLVQFVENCDPDLYATFYLALEALKVLTELCPESEKVAQIAVRLLEKLDNSPNDWQCDVLQLLGNMKSCSTEVLSKIADIFQSAQDLEAKYVLGIALKKLSPQHPEVTEWVSETLDRMLHSPLNSSFPHTSSIYLSFIWDFFAQTFLAEDTRSLTIEILEKILLAQPYCYRATELLCNIDSYREAEMQRLVGLLKDEVVNNDESFIRIVLSRLEKLGATHPETIGAIETFIVATQNVNLILESANILLRLEEGNLLALSALKSILEISLDDEGFKADKFNVMCILISHKTESVEDLVQYLDQPSIYEIESTIEQLHQSNQKKLQLFREFLDHLYRQVQEDPIPRCFYSIVDWLDIFSDDDLAQIVSSLQDKLDCQYDALYPTHQAIAWKSAQQLPYKTFCQAWNTPIVNPQF
jgi:hypothetical protein